MDDNQELLDWLVHKGFFPSFAFPLDLAVFNVTETVKRGGKTRSRKMSGFSRDMMLALRELSPGNEITVNKHTYEIGGLHVEYPIHGPIDRLEDYFDEIEIRYYNRCAESECRWVSTETESEVDGNCPVCEAAGTPNPVVSDRFFTPEGFAPIIYPRKKGRSFKNEPPNRRGRFTMGPEDVSRGRSGDQPRPRVILPSPSVEDENQMEEVWNGNDSWVGTKVFSALPEIQGTGTQLIVVNEGPMSEGYAFCMSCGAWEEKFDNDGRHHRPYPIDDQTLKRFQRTLSDNAEINDAWSRSTRKCDGSVSGSFMLGHVFRTDLIVIRFDLDIIQDTISTRLNSRHFTGAALALKEAIITSTQTHLGLMNREISGGIRKVVRRSQDGWKRYLDVFLYDTVPGGAGLVTRLRNHNDLIPVILDDSAQRLGGAKCTNATPCDRACTGCLLDFRNSIEHNVLNRPLGLQLALYFRDGAIPLPNCTALDSNPAVLLDHVADLNRFFETMTFRLEGDDIVVVQDGEQYLVSVHSPLVEPPDGIPHISGDKCAHSRVDYYESREQISLYEVFNQDDDWNDFN